MNVLELDDLAVWYSSRHSALRRVYNALLSPLQHNASQPNKQPLEEHLNNLVSHLRSMSFDTLSLEQLSLLEDMGVAQFLGGSGAAFVEGLVKTSDFDPATAVAKLTDAIAVIDGTETKLESYHGALDNLELKLRKYEPPSDRITVRIGFKHGAAIDDVVDFKDAGKEWHEIIRGIALAHGEAPEDTKVIGASTGSIILYLLATLAVTGTLAKVSKHLSGIAKDILDVETAREDLRQKKILTKTMEAEFEALVEGKRSSAVETALAEIQASSTGLDGEARNALEKSIEKLLKFNRKGGDLDFVTPVVEDGDEDDEDAERETEEVSELFASARQAILDYQAVRNEVRLLSDGRGNDNSFM